MRLLAVLAVLAVPAVASAHRMDLSVTVSATGVAIVAGFEDETPSEGATVKLFAGDALVAEGKTDDRGMVMLPRPPAGSYRLTADDGAGHKATLTVTVPPSEDEVSAATTAKRNRWLMTAAGLGIIGGVAVIGRRVARRR